MRKGETNVSIRVKEPAFAGFTRSGITDKKITETLLSL